jgi:hypothetical protein
MLPSRGHHCLGTDLFLFGIMSALHRARTGISRTAAAVYGVGHCWDESHLALRKRTRHDSQCPTAWYLQLSIHVLSVYRHSCHERPFSEDPIALSTFLANHSLRSEVCVQPRLVPCQLAYYQTLTVYRPLKKNGPFLRALLQAYPLPPPYILNLSFLLPAKSMLSLRSYTCHKIRELRDPSHDYSFPMRCTLA